MKVTFFFIFLVIFHFAASGEDVKSFVARAIVSILKEYFEKESPKVDIVCFGKCDDLVGEILKNRPETIAIRNVKHAENRQDYQFRNPSVVIFDSLETYRAIIDRIYWLRYRIRYKYIAYIPDATQSDIEHISDASDVDQVSFIINANKISIELAATFIFTKEKCWANQLRTINKFSRKSMRWETSNFYPDKYKNLYGCTLTVYLFHSSDQYLPLYEDLARRHNFKILETPDYNTADLHVRAQVINSETFMHASVAIYSDRFTFVVPPGDPYTQFEKMWLMFDPEVWIAIGVTFLLTLVAIQVINLCSIKVQNFVYGRGIQTPTMNFFDIFLNGGQRQVPGRNFARFILILFIVWSLIIRTCYQSMLYEYLQKDMRRPAVKTFENLRDRNFSYYGKWHDEINTWFDLPAEVAGLKEKHCNETAEHVNDWRDVEDERLCLDIISNPENRGFAHAEESQIIRRLNEAYRSGIQSFSLLDEPIFTFSVSLTFRWFSIFLETFNQRIEQYLSNGVIQQMTADNVNPKLYERREEDIGPEVLTLDHIGVGFLVSLIPLSFATVVFLVEVSIDRIRRLNNYLKQELVAFFVAKTFIRNLFPGVAKLPQKRVAKVRRKPLKAKTRFIQVKPWDGPMSRVPINVHAKVSPKAKSLNPQLDMKESLPQCPTDSVSSSSLLNFKAGSSTREVEAEEFGSPETSIWAIVEPISELVARHGKGVP